MLKKKEFRVSSHFWLTGLDKNSEIFLLLYIVYNDKLLQIMFFHICVSTIFINFINFFVSESQDTKHIIYLKISNFRSIDYYRWIWLLGGNRAFSLSSLFSQVSWSFQSTSSRREATWYYNIYICILHGISFILFLVKWAEIFTEYRKQSNKRSSNSNADVKYNQDLF